MKIKRYSLGLIILFSLIIFLTVFTFLMVNKSQVTTTKAEKIGFPIIEIVTDDNSPITSKDKYKSGKLSFENYTVNCKIRGRGNSSWVFPKKPYIVKFNHEISFLGMPEDDKWVFLANATDNTALRNAYATYLAKNVFDRQSWVPDYRFISLYINGKYEGLYQVYEKISMKKSKMNLPKGSYIVVSNTRESKTWNFRTKICNNGFSIYDPQNESERNALQIQEAINNLEKAIYSESKEWKNMIDMDSWIDWYWINEFTTNRDARLKDSCYFYFDSSDNKIHMGPSWDFDISCGNNSYDGCSTPDTFWVKTKGNWFSKLFEDQEFAEKVEQRYHEVHDNLQTSLIWLKAQTESNEMNRSKKYDDRVWRTIGHYQWPHATGWQYRKTYQQECEYLINWVNIRLKWIDSQFNK